MELITRNIMLIAAAFILGGGGFAYAENAGQEPVVKAEANSEIAFLNYDMVIGDKNAPVEIIEYAAISCPHCATFHKDVLPELKKKYLDSGKAKLIYRNYIFDNPFDVFASILTRCVPEKNFFPTVQVFFNNQHIWNNVPVLRQIFQEKGREAAIDYARGEVTKTGKIAGISAQQAEACFANDKVVNYLLKIRQVAYEGKGIRSTPTILVNGKITKLNDIETISKAIEDAEK